MNERMHTGSGLLDGLRHVVTHVVVTLLAIAIAFSLPAAAQYILYQWWPRVENNAALLVVTETSLAAALVLLFNGAKVAWDKRDTVAAARLASLVHARDGNGWLARWRRQRFMKRFPRSRDAYILTLTGFDTLVDPASPFRKLLDGAYEIRVLLMHPYGKAIERRAATLSSEITPESFREEIAAGMERLAALRLSGKKVTLRFYDQEPFWKVIVLSDHVWVQYCHSGYRMRGEPEYVFALQHRRPRQGFFVPFYMHFLDLWEQTFHPQYDFETRELVYRDAAGNETRRVPLEPEAGGNGAASGYAHQDTRHEELPA